MRELRTNIDYIYFQINNQNISENPNITANLNILRNTQYRRNSSPYIDIRRTRRNIIPQQNIINNFLEPVPIVPTITQIINATNILTFENIQNPVNIICPITRDPFEVTDIITQIKYCSHLFNSAALNTWFLSNCICPICRYDIRDYFTSGSLVEASHSTNVQTEPITTFVPTEIQPTPFFRFRDTSNNDMSVQQYARENAADLDTSLLRNYINATNLDISNNLIIFEAVITNNRNRHSPRNRSRNRNRFI